MASAKLSLPGFALAERKLVLANPKPCNRPGKPTVVVPQNKHAFGLSCSVDQTQIFIALVVALHAAVLAVRLSVALYRS